MLDVQARFLINFNIFLDLTRAKGEKKGKEKFKRNITHQDVILKEEIKTLVRRSEHRKTKGDMV